MLPLQPPYFPCPICFCCPVSILRFRFRCSRVASSNMSHFEPHPGFYRLLMKGIFDAYHIQSRKDLFEISPCAKPFSENLFFFYFVERSKDSVKNDFLHISKKNLCDGCNHRRRKYERCSLNSLRPISYFGRIWELYVLDIKTKVFYRK